ncbi:GspS/AspS pilotin family protein [Vibrio europaeus]|uniref:GspS/AspS pilotin family protein n=1 Tax=Vibrio europaeus TaxID=300876 RepID=A0A178JF39_9VIBR|nr:GspS/AspS pilotin family protein [Vibrio europaeus]MDC5707556.1 GspS/AspS pilotin family protein [Vibrio europaeus]MDC5709802.1 GspS/AspS pilotin family protein [Vibrio europaeus]MDC5716721.1 GspS/AspS pilotin family protein [Vibrio europaeus]MDC5722658.1 GspS/AspS pilotin family protein [Vibrio europaeus]MDC5727041.1 GspS/AspS pilotin family protein [Vibrio europaeus]
MLNSLKSFSIVALVVLVAGCSSASSDKQKQLELLAQSRANLLATELPLESGPLSIMRASAKGSTIEIMMVYNDDAKGAKPATQVLNQSIRTYCTTPDTMNNLEVGISYRIKMRNSRGQLMADEFVTQQRCISLTK